MFTDRELEVSSININLISLSMRNMNTPTKPDERNLKLFDQKAIKFHSEEFV